MKVPDKIWKQIQEVLSNHMFVVDSDGEDDNDDEVCDLIDLLRDEDLWL